MSKTTQLQSVHSQKASTKYDGQKRGFDLAVTGLAILALAPLLAFIALAVRLSSKGPVFFKQ